MYGKGTVSIISDKTMSDFNIDISTLHIGSHKKVWVECERCNEKFTREYRHIHQKHACPVHTEREDGVKLKWCNKCDSFLTYQCFSKNSARYDGLSSYCNSCKQSTKSSMNNNKKKSIKRSTNIDDWLKWAICIKKSKCKKSGVKFDIDFDYLKQQWIIQDGKCYYSKIDLEFGNKSLRSAWMERIEPSLGYTKNNVVWASKLMNSAKSDASEGDFLELLSLIKNGIDSTPIRLEFLKINENARIPTRSRTTDAGYDIYSIEDAIIKPHSSMSIKTGMALSCPPEFYYTIEGRSGLGLKGVVPFRGIIDATYCGEVVVVLYNRSSEQYEVKNGDRIAQICLHRIIHADIVVVKEFSPTYNQRGTAGFGSSGS